MEFNVEDYKCFLKETEVFNVNIVDVNNIVL